MHYAGDIVLLSQSETADIQLKMQDFRLQLLALIDKVMAIFQTIRGTGIERNCWTTAGG